MTWAAVAIGGAAVVGSVVGGVVSAGAASDAADAQVAASRDAQATQWRMYQQMRADQEPYRLAGYGALARLRELNGQPLSYGPWNPSQYAFTPPNAATLQLDPGYQFRVQEGQKALERSGSAQGMTLSGAQQKALTRFGQDYGSQEYQNAYARALGENQLRYNRGLEAYQTNYNTLTGLRSLDFNENASVAGLGQTAVGQLGQLGSATGGRLSDLQTGAGNAQAAGIIGGANAYNTMLQNIGGAGNNYLQYQLLSQLWRNGAAGAPGAGGPG